MNLLFYLFIHLYINWLILPYAWLGSNCNLDVLGCRSNQMSYRARAITGRFQQHERVCVCVCVCLCVCVCVRSRQWIIDPTHIVGLWILVCTVLFLFISLKKYGSIIGFPSSIHMYIWIYDFDRGIFHLVFLLFKSYIVLYESFFPNFFPPSLSGH